VDIGGGPGIGDRAFGSDAEQVTAAAGAVLEGYLAAGVTPILKHFPGHGRASQDTHNGAASTPPLADLRSSDLVPFETLLGKYPAGVMVGHLLVPGLTEALPTSLSTAAIDGLLRGELGHDGFVMTDALGMGAVAQQFDQSTAAVLAIAAGADMVILGDLGAIDPTHDALAEALADGRISRSRIDRAAERVFEIKGVDPCSIQAGP
jgi:beta-N-acetylhexosaminidase